MNELFVNVKVDREERPDVDALTMDACVTMTGQGGWPTTVFLTPDGKPFYAGTYFPPEPRHGIPSFRQLLQAIADAWRDRRGELEGQAVKLVDALGGASRLTAGDAELSPALLDAAERALARDYEPAFGGFGTAPKFPPSSALELLLRRGGPEATGMVRRTLDGMAAGGLYDVVGGGFHRYSVDARWLVPHFEKMLYDNALLASTYLHAWVVTGEERYRAVVEETIDYLLREMRLESGGFASAQDADTDGVEGLTYTWTPEEWGSSGSTRRCSSRSSTVARSCAASSTPRRRRACSRSATGVRSRSATTRRSPPGTGWRWPRSPRPPVDSSEPTGCRQPRSSARSCSGRSAATTVASCAASGTVA